MVDSLIEAFGVVFQWPNPLWIIGAVIFGMFIGFLPGMSGAVALALVIPLSFGMDTELAILFLIAAYSPTGFGGMLTSILVNTPGAPENAATTFDGYPLAKQGRAGAAIGAATAASVLGGLIGTVFLIAMIPAAQKLILSFSYPEFFMMAILGLSIIAVITVGNVFKGLIAAGAGFLIAFIGLDPIAGSPRFTFGEVYLWGGIDIVPLLLGLFAGSELLTLFGKGTTISQTAIEKISDKRDEKQARAASKDEPVTFWEGVSATFRYKFLIFRASVIGVVVGVIPGVGGSVASFVAYAHAKQTSKHPEKFGKGAIDGVIAAEAANDSKEGGSLLPTVAFGIPGSVGMAVLLGALIMHGVPAGPALMIDNANIIYLLIAGMVTAKAVAPFVVWAVSKQAIKLTRVRPGLFTPLIAIAALVGAYTVRLDMTDVFVALIFSYVGYAMVKYDFSRIALLIAVVLGGLVEQSFHQTVATFGSISEVALRPISGTLFVLNVVFLVYAALKAYRDRDSGVTSLESGEANQRADRIEPGRLIFTLIILGFSSLLVVSSLSIDSDARTMPLAIGSFVIVGIMIQLALDGRRVWNYRTRANNEVQPSESDSTILDVPTVGSGGVTRLGAQLEAAQTQVYEAESSNLVEELYSERQVLWRQILFSVWAVIFVVISMFTGFLVSVPLCLLAFLLLLARERWLISVALTVGAAVVLYVLFVVMLGVNLA